LGARPLWLRNEGLRDGACWVVCGTLLRTTQKFSTSDSQVMFDTLFSTRGLSLDRLRSFLEMAEAGGIAKAAPGDPVRQSQISRQIRELEEFFGTELTQRRGKGLVLTPAGRRLAGLVRGQLQGLDDFRREEQGRPKAFVFGAGASTIESMIAPRLPGLADALGGALLRTESHRSRALVEAVQEGRVDFAVVRRDAVADPSKKNCLPVVKLSFHLCIPRRLLPKGKRAADPDDPASWATLPFAAGRDGGQLDQAIREAMKSAGVDFRPRFECGSMLQVRQLVVREDCAAVLPNLALPGLDEQSIHIAPFAPLANYGRVLVLHWNPRQMELRGVDARRIAAAAKILAGEAEPLTRRDGI